MTSQTRRLLSVYALVLAISTVFGMAQAPRTVVGMAGGGASGALIGLALTFFESQVRDVWARRLRKFEAWKIALVRVCVYLGCFILIPDAVGRVILILRPDLDWQTAMGDRRILLYAAFSVAVNLFMAVRRMLGARNLLAMATGRYHRPQAEERIVAFMDLKGSTPLAERLGGARYHDFLNDVFFDAAGPILEHGGEVYQYVGDEIVVTWRAEKGLRGASCIAFLFAIEDALARQSAHYLADYGATPALRGALHIGQLMVGEIGDLNRQIVMIGDTMNTAARIEGACRKFGRDYVASAALLDRVAALPPGIGKESLGPVPLAGKAEEMELFALKRG